MPDPITIVTGLPRSGTSLMMQMLAAGGYPILTDGRRVADEDNPRGYYEYEPVKDTRKDASWLDDAGGRAVKVVTVLLRDLPADRRYRVLYMQRGLQEVVSSQRVMLDRRGETGARVEPAKLVSMFQAQQLAMEGWLGEQAHFDVRMIDHHAAVHEPDPVIEMVIGFLGVPLDAGAMRGVIDPSLYRQRIAPAAR